MDMESPSIIEENGLTTFSPSEVEDEDEHITWRQNNMNSNDTKRRRLVITTMTEEPIFIEIRSNFPKSLIPPLVCNSTQCDVIENECFCKSKVCLEHMNLWNELYQAIHDTNTSNFSNENWFKKLDVGKNSPVDVEKGTNSSELWPNICAQALDNIISLKYEIRKEKEEREKYALALTKFNDLEEQLELEKNMHKQECQKLEAIILELNNQVSSQSEEIRRLWTENLTIERDEVSTKSDENEREEIALETKQEILPLEHDEAKEFSQQKLTLRDQETQCESLQSNDDKSEIIGQIVRPFESIEHDCVKLQHEMENKKIEYQEKNTSSSTVDKDGSNQMLDYATLVKERDNLKEELEKVNNNFNQTTSKLRANVAKRRRLEAESEGEKQQRSNLAAALYDLENELESTISVINSLQSTTLESMAALTNDLQKFQEVLEKRITSNNSDTKPSIQDDDEIIKSHDSDGKQSPTQNLEITSSNTFKSIPETRSVISRLTQGNESLLAEIASARKAIKRALKSHKRRVHIVGKEMTSKLENIESQKETFRRKTKVLDEENKSLEEENSKLQQEVSSLKHAKSKLTLQLKDLEKEMEDTQESFKNLREENRRLLKEARWKSIGKQGGYQESLIVQEWEKKLQKLEADYETLRQVKKDLVKEKYRLEDELDRAMEKGYKGSGGNDDRKLEEELFNMTQERNKLRKIKITLAIENVSLKESLAELRTQADALESECELLQEWKDKVRKLEEECEDLRDWKKKAEALEMECKDLWDDQMKVEAHEIEMEVKNSKIQKLGEGHQKVHKSVEGIDKESCENIGNTNCCKEECKKLRECKIELEKECQNLCQRLDDLEKNQNLFSKPSDDGENLNKIDKFSHMNKVEIDTLESGNANQNDCCKLEENTQNSKENIELLDVDKLKTNSLECEINDLSEDGSKVEVGKGSKSLFRSSSTNTEDCNIQECLEKIATLEQENMKLCSIHQAALDKQWDVLQADLKAYEAKVEELENECESVRRDHLSSMVESAELVREKEKLLTLYNDQKYNYEILETANECLQKDQEQKEAQRNEYLTSIDNLKRQVMELESALSKRSRQQVSNYEHNCLASKTKINGQETITLSRQEYEILLAEKAVMLQERDSAHKKLCSAEVQNLQLSATIECLRKEVTCTNQAYKQKENDVEVLLAQDVVNLRSMLASLEEELETANCERNKLLEMNTSMRRELNELHEALSRCQHENKNLNSALDELRRRSSLEHIHSAASSLKEQLGKATKEKDLIKEQLNKEMKEKEHLANVASDKDKAIVSLKEKIAKLEKGDESIVKAQSEDATIQSHVKDQSMTTAKDKSQAKEEVIILKHEMESLNNKLLHVNNDLMKKTKSWQKERSDFEEKCRRLEVELMNTKETLDMMKKKMQDDLQEAIQEKDNFELIVKKEVKNAHAQVSQLQDELFTTKQNLTQKLELATKEMENIAVEKTKLVHEIEKLREKNILVQKEKENHSNDVGKCNEHTKHLTLSGLADDSVKNPNILIPKSYLEQGIQVEIREELKLETKKIYQLEQEEITSLNTQNDESIDVINEIQVPHHDNKHEKKIISKKIEHELHTKVSTVKAFLANEVNDKEQVAILEESSSKDLNDLSLVVQSSNEPLSSNSYEKDCLVYTKEVTLEPDDLLTKTSTFEKQHEKVVKLEENDTSENTSLMYGKLLLLEDHENLTAEILLLKKEKGEIEHKLNKLLKQKNISLNEYANALAKAEQDLHEKHEQYENLMKENKRLKEENVILAQTIKTYDQMKNEYSSLVKSKSDLSMHYDELLSFNQQQSELLDERDNVVTREQAFDCATIKSEKNNSFNESMVTKSMVPKEMDQIQILQTSVNSLKDEHMNLMKDNEKICIENAALSKERDGLITSISLLKKQHETILTQDFKKQEVTTLEVTLQQKFEEIVESINTLNRGQESNARENELIMPAVETLTKECNNLFASLKDEQRSPCSNVEHQPHAMTDHAMVVKDASHKLEVVFKAKLEEFAKKITVLVQEIISSTKEKEKLMSEMASLKRECQKLHMALVVAERDKDTLMKSVVESRSASECLGGEISRLQKELVEVEMKLAHITAERDNANFQIADLQKLLSNHQRVQHLQGPYSMENFETLEPQNRCLRMEKENYQFQQQMPSMTNFRIQKVDPYPLPRAPLHTSPPLFLYGKDTSGRPWPPPPPPPMLHQQWPI